MFIEEAPIGHAEDSVYLQGGVVPHRLEFGPIHCLALMMRGWCTMSRYASDIVGVFRALGQGGEEGCQWAGRMPNGGTAFRTELTCDRYELIKK
jgi:hypothetical protein